MRRHLTLLLLAAIACRPAEPPPPTAAAATGSYLYVFAGDADHTASERDFLAVIDADTTSATYAQVRATVPIGAGGTMPHHTELDSIAAVRPATNAHIILAANLTAARLFEAAGDNASALAAVRRRTRSLEMGATVGLSTLLRDEGRLAAAVGDAPAAVRAYSVYLALRTDAAPVFADDVADVRRRLAALYPDRPR